VSDLKLTLTDYPLRRYERKLARLEAEQLGVRLGRSTREAMDAVSSTPVRASSLRRLTFFKAVRANGREIVPAQRPLDLSGTLVRRSLTPDALRSATRDILSLKNGHRASVHTYLTHGLHEYKGKFYPQLVRCLANYAGISTGTLLDPFCGSGTTTLEGFLIGLESIGIDLNPLAALIARTKVSVLQSDPNEIHKALDSLESRIVAERSRRRRPPIELPNEDYLRGWFDSVTLDRLRFARWCIDQELPTGAVRDLCLVVLSNGIRGASLQRPGQLRIYRRAEAPDTKELLSSLIKQARRMASASLVYQQLRTSWPIGGGRAPRVYAADARRLGDIADSDLQPSNRIDAVITSPPYATALPYLDTDRLSLAFLGLMSPNERRKFDFDMIGNREITERNRKLLEEQLGDDRDLPTSIRRFLMRVLDGNRRGSVGFRRRNAAALLYKYFADMRAVIAEVDRVLKPRGLFAIVIGNSRTVVGGTNDIEIPTDRFLLALTEQIGFERDQWIPMTDQMRYMAHNKNGIRNETIFTVRRRR
jgi:DNA modification methylase